MNQNRYLEAFKESFNLVGLATAASASLALMATPLMPIPILIGLVAEAAYLLFVPDLKWYQQRLARVHDADIQKRRDESKAKILPLLRPEMQHRFARMEAMIAGIEAQGQAQDNAARQAGGWFREVLRKLDFLIEKFLQFAAREVQFRDYLLSVLAEVRSEKRIAPHKVAPNVSHENVVQEIQDHYDRELSQLKNLRHEESDSSTQAVLEKRLEVLGRRREFVGKIGKVLSNLNHQLLLLEDTFGLISDELRARPPEQVIADIDDVVFQTKTMTELLEEMAPYESTLSRAVTN